MLYRDVYLALGVLVMPSARAIAIEILPHFKKHVLAGPDFVFTYGYYAACIGRDPAKESLVIGPAMHTIGALCVCALIPVAPLHYVKRDDGSPSLIFEEDFKERMNVLPHRGVMKVAARIFKYTEAHFQKMEEVLREVVKDSWSPHKLWHAVIDDSYTNSDRSVFEHALEAYKQLIKDAQPGAPADGARPAGE